MHIIPNAFSIHDYEPPMGDLFSDVTFGACLSMWTGPTIHESTIGAPGRRIIHAMVFKPHGPVAVHRLGVKSGPGYHKCGSRQDHDWVVDLRVMGLRAQEWEEIAYLTDLKEPQEPNAVQWISLDTTVSALVCEIRRSGIDGWWTPWNLAASAFRLESNPVVPGRRDSRLLTVKEQEASGKQSRENATGRTDFPVSGRLELPTEPPPGTWRVSGGGVAMDLVQTRAAAVGLHVAGSGTTATSPFASLLAVPAGSDHQGTFAAPVGAAPWIDNTVRCAVEGQATHDDSRVTYELATPDGALNYSLAWQGEAAGLSLEIEKRVTREIATWESAAWRFTFDTRVSVTSLVGELRREGRTGLVELPAILHFPRFGSLRVESDSPEVMLRWETNRPANRVMVEIKVAESPGQHGEFIHPAGDTRATLRFIPCIPDLRLAADTPGPVRNALTRTLHTALTFRPDTGTLSNNGASIHCPICMDMWASVMLPVRDVGAGIPGHRLVQYSLERWLDGGPGYASGTLRQDGAIHPAEDEYLMTGTAALLGLAMWLETKEGRSWVPTYLSEIVARIDEMAARDLDGDGIVESPYRTGVSGTGQWSTCWLDVLSFGWKDAFSNALLYGALVSLAETMHALNEELAVSLKAWHRRLKGSYLPAFYNEETGWLAGWRCKENVLHDYAFPQLNGAAVAAGVVDPEQGREMLLRLLSEMERVGVPSAELGLPGNLWNIPDADRADIMWGFPMGYYQNGGRTHAQTRHFLNGLYAAGLRDEADELLETLCSGLSAGLTYGGNQSGVDWRYWDDRPCGYEGLLTDQFGLLGTALARYSLD